MNKQSEIATAISLFGVRLIVAAIFLWHGVPKAIDWGAAVTKFVGFGLPGFLGPLTGIVEVVASILLLTGVLYRSAAMVLLIVILGAIVTVQLPAGITASLERDLLIFMAMLVLLAAGPRPIELSRMKSDGHTLIG